MTKNRIRVICIVMVLTMAVLGVVAFADGTQQSREIKAQNSEPVQIEQIEQERIDTSNSWIGESNVRTFTQYGMLEPATYKDNYSWYESNTSGMWLDIQGARDKIVTVANRGQGGIYFRTIIAYEINPDVENMIKINLNTADYDWNQSASGGEVAVIENVPLNYTYNSGEVGAADYNIKGNFNVIVGVYNRQVLPPEGTSGEITFDPVLACGEISSPSLLQVAMDKKATDAQIRPLGDSYEIFVWSQAVAASNSIDAVTALNDRFGKITANDLKMPAYKYKAVSSDTSADTVSESDTSTIASDAGTKGGAGTATDDNISPIGDAGGAGSPVDAIDTIN